MVIAIAGTGTREADWQAWPRLHRFPALELTGCRRVVLLAPHPDDEVLGAGGLLRLLHRRGAAVDVVAVTDGDASHPGSPTTSPTRLAARRRRESTAALVELGLATAVVHRLGLVDGAVAGAEPVITAALADLLAAAGPGTWCLSTWDGDGHPDHEAVGRAARAVAAHRGVPLLMYPIWTWHWAAPADPRVPWSRARSVGLDPETSAAKRAAVRCFGSQIAPLSAAPEDAAVLTPAMLDRLCRDMEVVFR